MIINDQQYNATKRAVSELRESLVAINELKLMEKGIDLSLIKAQRNSVEVAIRELEHDLKSYDQAKKKQKINFDVASVDDLGSKLIAARIANGWTQKELADRLNVKEQQVQRYEKEKYRMASLERVNAVARVLGARLTGRLVEVVPNDRSGRPIGEFLSQVATECFPFGEMRKRHWLSAAEKTRFEESEKRDLIGAFFADSGIQYVSPMLHSRTAREIDASASCAMLAWQARVRQIVRNRDQLPNRFTKVTADLVREIAHMSAKEKGPLEAVKMLELNGIHVVLLPHLPKTLLDGAAMLSDAGEPIIGMTLRHDRLDNFWRVLLHELGHISKHWNCGLAEGFIDEEDCAEEDPREREADEFARNAMIPDEIWKTSFVRYARTKEQIVDFARALEIGPAVVAGRLRFERKDFTALGDLVGNNTVRVIFRQAGLLEG